VFFIIGLILLATQLGQARTKKYLPPRHKDTKDFILLFFPSGAEPLWGSALVSWCLGGEKKKVLPQKAQNSQLRT
jgi:hypothetical protein